MPKKRKVPKDHPVLFELPEASLPEAKLKPIHKPIWTENKAKLIKEYLYRFVMVTHHGTYIDAFAGPQEPEKYEMWAAKLVLESKPRWLRRFHLFEIEKDKIKCLEELKQAQPTPQPGEPRRSIQVHRGDCNAGIIKLLNSNTIRQKEATFCLLDQRTFECCWSTVEALASYKTSENKIELFYFLANSWLDRALANQQDTEVLEKWWGKSDWACLRKVGTWKRGEILAKRFKEELGYKYVKSWPIYQRENGGGNVMYFMIHASDHSEAPKLMRRAYEAAVHLKPSAEQTSFEFEVSSAKI